jgi:hypothetical protein
VRKNFVDTGTTTTITGTGAFSASTNAITAFNEGDLITVKLVTSAAASLSGHRVGLKLAYFG